MKVQQILFLPPINLNLAANVGLALWQF